MVQWVDSMRIAIICTVIFCLCATTFAVKSPQESFRIGVYISMGNTGDTFVWDYMFMDLARIGCNYAVVSGNCYAGQWAAAKHWGIAGVNTYSIMNYYPGAGAWSPDDLESLVLSEKGTLDIMYHNGEYVGDAVVGRNIVDEPEAHGGKLTEDEQDFLRTYSDFYHLHLPDRDVYVNHSNPPWYDLHESKVSCSTGATIMVNSQRISDRINHAQSRGFENYSVVCQTANIAWWMNNDCGNINAIGLGPCSQAVKDWLAARNTYQDVYEMLSAAYLAGANGCTAYRYNYYLGGLEAYAFVDPNGNDNGGRRAGYSDAAHDVRRAQGCPSVTLANNGVPFNDRGNYSAGQFTLTADAESVSGTIQKVIFGKTTNGGSDWETIEDTTAPYSAAFSTSAGQTVIFRSQAVDTTGKKSIYAANMIYTN